MEFNKARVNDISRKIQKFLDELSEKEGVKMEMDGGRFSLDTFNLKIKGTLLTKAGETLASPQTNFFADSALRSAGVEFKSPHVIGSVWNFAKSGLVLVTGYQRSNRKYPFLCRVYGDGRGIKSSATSFRHGTEVVPPMLGDILTWLTVDQDDDAVSREQEETCDRVNDYVCARFESHPQFEELFELLGRYYAEEAGDDSKKDAEAAYHINATLIGLGDVSGAVKYLKEVLL